MKELLSIKELAERWGYKISWIYNKRYYCPNDLPKPYGLGKKYKLDDVIKFEKSKMKKMKKTS